MSPEQAGGAAVDGRTDVYSLGAVLYEMLVGEPPFTGPSVQAIVARLLSEEPRSLGTQRKAIPEQVEFGVMRALEKLPADRWATAREYADALEGSSGSAASHGAPPPRYARAGSGVASWSARLRDPVVVTLGAIALATSIVAGWAWRSTPTATVEQREVRFAIPSARNGSGATLGLSDLAISHDGRLLVYIARNANGRDALMIRPLDDIRAQRTRLDQRTAEITAEHARIRENMQRLQQNSDLYNRYVKKLDQQETELEKLRKDIESLKSREDEQRRELQNYVMNLDIA
jgi:serine/threonine-protein kinase